MRPVDVWAKDFGKAYTDRNVIDWQERLPAFKTMLEGLSIKSVLEVGCNRGHNLRAIAEMLSDAYLVGVEPNDYAIKIAKNAGDNIYVIKGDASNLPFKERSFELVFTAGVLIHIPPAELEKVLKEIYRTSSKYILAVEYYSEQEEEIVYRGQTGLLWKRPFLKCYQNLFKDIVLVKEGYWDKYAFDRSNWWLMEKKI
jgi:pseudaminic acid biosynthesis-associated methylase